MYEVTATVEGMMCEKCEARASQAIRDALDVMKVKASHDAGTIVITAKEDISQEQVVQALADTKFTCTGASSIQREAEVKEGGLFGFLK